MDKTRGLQDGAGHLAGRREKEFFFAKKNQKIFAPVGGSTPSTRQPDKSLLLLFFRKEGLPCLPVAINFQGSP